MRHEYFPPTVHQLRRQRLWEGLNFVVGIPFPFSGRQYRPGEPFDRSLGTPAQIERLYRCRKLVRVHPTTVRELPPAEPSPPLAVKHLGFGKWCVVQGTDRIGDPKSKEEAEAELAILAA